MTDINNLIEICADITKSKGFKTDHHATQIALIATEVAEALECVTPSDNATVDYFIRNLIADSEFFEGYRKRVKDHTDKSTIKAGSNLLEELADIVIRVFSYVGGNEQREEFVIALVDKINANRSRAMMHGKGF